MDRLVERELRQDIKEINEKLTDIQVSLEVLKTKQNTGAGIFKFIVTIIIASVSGLFGAHFSK